MTKYFVELPDQYPEEISAEAYSIVVSGTAILAVRTLSRGFELDLSERLRIRSIVEGQDNFVYLSSTLEKGEFRPARIQLSTAHEELPALEVERRLRHLRQLYAMLVLLESDRAAELARLLEGKPDADLELLLHEHERLVLEAAGQGSFWADIRTAAEKVGGFVAGAPKAAAMTVAALFTDGRRILLEYVQGIADEQKAKAQLKQAEAVKMLADARSIDRHSAGDLEKARADAEKTRAEARRIEEERRKERDERVISVYKKADEVLDGTKSIVVKKKLEEHINGVNPELPPAPSPRPRRQREHA